MAVVFALTIVMVAAIAGWAAIGVAQSIGRGARSRTNQELGRHLQDLGDAVLELRQELDRLADKQDQDAAALEERLDFAERLLTRAREGSAD